MKEHTAMKKDCERLAMGEKSGQGSQVAEDTAFQMDNLPAEKQTVLYESLCPPCDCPSADADASKIESEYNVLRDKHLRLQERYHAVRAREMKRIERLPKLAQYELAALPTPWTAHMHPLGRTFYFNHESGVSSWHDPRQVPTPKVEACPFGVLADKGMRGGEAQEADLQQAADNMDVPGELWGSDDTRAGIAGARKHPPPSPSKLTGLPVAVETHVLSDSESYLSEETYSPLASDLPTSSRQSGIVIDTPRGSQLRGELYVSGPSLEVPLERPQVASERPREAETFVGGGERRLLVILDADRLWLMTSASEWPTWTEGEGHQRARDPGDEQTQSVAKPLDYGLNRYAPKCSAVLLEELLSSRDPGEG